MIDCSNLFNAIDINYTACITKNCCREFVDWQTPHVLLQRRFSSEIHFFDCCLVFGGCSESNVSSIVMNRCKIWSGSRFNNVNHSFEVVKWLRLWSIVSKRCTHSANGSIKPKKSSKTETEISTSPTISHTFNLWSDNTMSCTFSLVFGVDTSNGRPERFTSLVLLLQQQKSIHHFLTIEFDGSKYLRSVSLVWIMFCFAISNAWWAKEIDLFHCRQISPKYLVSLGVKHKLIYAACSNFDRNQMTNGC